MSVMSKKMLTPKQVGELLQVKPRTVTKWCREKRITPAHKLGKVWRIDPEFEVKENDA